MIFVSVPILSSEIYKYSHRLFLSFTNFTTILNDKVFFHFVIQEDDPFDLHDFKKQFNSFNCEYILTKFQSVSNARNIAIDIFLDSVKFDKLVFHDAGIIYSQHFLQYVNNNATVPIIYAKPFFTNDFLVSSGNINKSISTFNPFAHGFVCGFIFTRDCIFPKFNIDYGPGSNSLFKSGEDFLFLNKFFDLNPSLVLFPVFSASVLHIPRPPDFSKHLLYAFGQGKIHQIYLLENKSFYALYRLLLFFGHAFLNLFLLKKHSFSILLLRVKGFLHF